MLSAREHHYVGTNLDQDPSFLKSLIFVIPVVQLIHSGAPLSTGNFREKTMLRMMSPLECESMLLRESKPVLLACLRKDAEFQKQLEAVEEVHREVGDRLEIYLLDEDFLATVWEKYGFRGTPTFMIFSCGQTRAKHLGRATATVLSRFIYDYLNSQTNC